ncbi:MAG: ATP-binding cassette domain-containing protein, partial [Paracoccaceae bacterium]|nr:ATP-binding cassette domain-containing protein [Paracoccaceae bacterium]
MVTPILPLTLSQVQVVKQGKRILGPLDYKLSGRGITVVLGPNGSGKTTFLRTMHGLEHIRAGRLYWACTTLAARKSQAFVFQTPILLRRTVLDNIAYPLLVDGSTKATAYARAQEIAERIGLGGLLGVMGTAISGGEKQKLALARALVRKPQVLFLDEPCANLDGSATKDIEAILMDEKANGTRLIMSTHNVAQARRLADDVIFLYRGLLHDQGPSATFFTTPATNEALTFL